MMQPIPSQGVGIKANGPPPADAACLYDGWVMHQRMKPFGHRFRYRVFSLAIDLDRLDEAGRQTSLFSINRRNLVSFFETDHIQGSFASLRDYADRLLMEAGIETRAARILLVCYPRIFGYVFNPLSVYHAYGDDGRLLAMIYEVRNTFGQRHSYVCPITASHLSAAGVRQSCDKAFHVSPFIAMSMRYHFRMLPPGKAMRWRILETDSEGPLLAATFSGEKKALTGVNLLRLGLRLPFLTVKILGGIHWEALKLWLKGARYIPKPAAPGPVSIIAAPSVAEPAE